MFVSKITGECRTHIDMFRPGSSPSESPRTSDPNRTMSIPDNLLGDVAASMTTAAFVPQVLQTIRRSPA
jgi:hypothetical protein